MKLEFISLIFCICSVGCTTLEIPAEFQYTEIKTLDFDFASWQKITDTQSAYKIYIEGDGYSFNAHGMPTSDPTPHGTLVRELAFGDEYPNVVYMARACQFIYNKKCEQKYWTTGRFAPEIVAAQADAVKQISGLAPVTFIGFSGGAQIAGLIAVKYPEINVKKIVTVAGNLDHSAWTKYHNVLPLKESLNLNDYKTEFEGIPQTHYVGTNDTVVPMFITKNFVADHSTIIEINGASHNNGWSDAFADIRAQ